MSTAPPLLTLAAMLLVAGCSRDARHDAEKALHHDGATHLRLEAATFYKDLFTAPEARYFVPNLEKCPPSFRSLNPLRVRAYPDGFAITLLESRGVEQGLYVVPQSMEKEPREGRSAEFEKMADGIYWYRFTD
jgi:hypothetical protein